MRIFARLVFGAPRTENTVNLNVPNLVSRKTDKKWEIAYAGIEMLVDTVIGVKMTESQSESLATMARIRENTIF